MPVLGFLYRNASGVESLRTLISWSENSLYIQGRRAQDTISKTYRKDRIVRMLEGAELLLAEAAPPAPQPSPRKALDDRPQILFTGFKAADRARLETQAADHGFRVVKGVTKGLAVICIGYNAGPAKVEDAREKGAFIVTEEQLGHLLLTGEVLR